MFNFNAKGQEADEALIQPQFIQLEPKDEFICDDTQPLELQPEFELLTFDPPKIELDYQHTFEELEIYVSGFMVGTFIPITPPPPAVSVVSDPLYTLKSEREKLLEDAAASNLILINDLKLTFFIEEDVLIFNSNTLDATAIRLKIIKKGEENWIYSDYIHLKAGQREIHFPLNEYENGEYYILIENNGIRKVVQVGYW